MKIAALILGVIGGIAGIFGSIMAIFVGGVGSALKLQDSSTVVGLGLAAIFLSLLGIVGGALAIAKPKAAGIMMLMGGIGGIIAISAGYIIAGPLLIIAGIFALMGAGKENKLDTQWAKQATEIKKKNFIWVFWTLGIIIILIILSVIGSKTEEKGKAISVPSTSQKQIDSPKVVKKLNNPLVGKWRGGDLQEFQKIEFRSDGTVTADMVIAMSTLARAEAKYKLSGDNKIEFEVTSAKCLWYMDGNGNQIKGEDNPESNEQFLGLGLAQAQLLGMWDYYVSPSGKELTMTNSITMQVIELVRE